MNLVSKLLNVNNLACRAVNSANNPLFKKIMEHIYVATPPAPHNLAITIETIQQELQKMNFAQIQGAGFQNMSVLQQEQRHKLLLALDLYKATLSGYSNLIDMGLLSLTYTNPKFPIFGLWSYGSPFFSIGINKEKRGQSFFNPNIPEDLQPHFQEVINEGLGLAHQVTENRAIGAEFVGQMPSDLVQYINTCQKSHFFESFWIIGSVSCWGINKYALIGKKDTTLIVGRHLASVSSEAPRYFLLGAFEPGAWKTVFEKVTPALCASY